MKIIKLFEGDLIKINVINMCYNNATQLVCMGIIKNDRMQIIRNNVLYDCIILKSINCDPNHIISRTIRKRIGFG